MAGVVDLNLLRVLDALLQSNSVTAAAEALGTSPPAVSRSLSRLRRLAGDPLLVRAGQGLVPTPRAVEIRDTLHVLLGEAHQILSPGDEFDPITINHTFTVQVSELFLASVAAPLIELLQRESPGVTVVFVPEALEGTDAMRRGDVDVELGVLAHLDPETHHQSLMSTPLLGVARRANPLFDGPIDAARFADAAHVGVSRQGKRHGPIDDALASLGLHRRVAVVVPSHVSALLLAQATDLVAPTAPVWDPAVINELGLTTFPIPLELPEIDVGMSWHPRTDSDPAHRWFRARLSQSFNQAGHVISDRTKTRAPSVRRRRSRSV